LSAHVLVAARSPCCAGRQDRLSAERAGLAFLPPGRTGALRGPVSSIGTRLSRAASSLKP